MRTICAGLIFVLCAGAASGVGAAQWGDLSGQFLYDGTPPTPPPAKITKDKECCDKYNVVDESLLVNPENKGVRNVVVYLYPATSKRGGSEQTPLRVHDSYKESAKAEVKLDNLKCRFDPHVVLLRTSQTLLIANSDPIGHNTKIDTFRNEPINYTIASGGSLKHQFVNPERMPARVSCSIHPWMVGWVLIRDNPYMAVTDKDGKFHIKNVPVTNDGLQFMFWHEEAGYVDQVTIGGQKQKWEKGRVTIDIKPGENDLGAIKLSPKLFESAQ